MKKVEVESVVVGGGPGGSVAARELAGKGIESVLLEKRQEVGAPVRCAEGVGREVEHFIEVDNCFIAAEVEGAKIYSPDGTEIEMGPDIPGGEVGYVLERKIFDRELVKDAVRHGADVFVNCRAEKVYRENGKWMVLVNHCGERKVFETSVVIGADGVESNVGRWLDLSGAIGLGEIMSCAQFLVSGVDFDEKFTHFYFGDDFAPGGYGWVFPKGRDTANVGVGVQPTLAEKEAVKYLKDFCRTKGFNEGSVVEVICGGVPVSTPLKKTYTDGALLVGDAARFSDPLTGGGIMNAMKSGLIAAETVAEGFRMNDLSAEKFSVYQGRCMERFGETLEQHFLVKEALSETSEEDLNELAEIVKGSDLNEFRVERLVERIVEEKPEFLGFLEA